MTDIQRIDDNMKMLAELFQKDDEQILKENTMKDLSQIYMTVYGCKVPSYVSTKANALKQLHLYYHSIRRADALSALGRRYY